MNICRQRCGGGVVNHDCLGKLDPKLRFHLLLEFHAAERVKSRIHQRLVRLDFATKKCAK